MKYGKALFALVSLVIASSAVAGELDRDASVAPQGLIVRVDASGNREVFKANMQGMVSNDQEAALAAELATADNQVQTIVSGNELDRASSTEAWCYWYAPTYYGNYYYSYYNYSYAYNWNYYPYYRWNAYGYNYYYYYGYRW